MKSVVTKLSQIMAEVTHVPKNGRNDFHKYDYATEADIVASVRKAMAERKLIMVPKVISNSRTNDGTTTQVVFTVWDGDTGEYLEVAPVVGEGHDKSDKGPYKSLTGAVKYALLK